LNASDERGIQVVRDKIKKYSQKQAARIIDRKVPHYQIVILDEADSMTTDAQSALRRVIEDYAKTTRFCFICNYVSKIIDPIASRCAKFRFNALPREKQYERMTLICKNENLKLGDNIINYLIDISEGDLRRGINLLQSIGNLGPELLTEEILNDVCGTIPNEEVKNLFEIARFQNSQTLIKESDAFFSSGYDLRQFLTQLNAFVANNKELSDSEKSRIFEIIMDTEINLLENSSAQINMYNLMCEIRKLFAMAS
jgi:replication factor C subunit 2/4